MHAKLTKKVCTKKYYVCKQQNKYRTRTKKLLYARGKIIVVMHYLLNYMRTKIYYAHKIKIKRACVRTKNMLHMHTKIRIINKQQILFVRTLFI